MDIKEMKDKIYSLLDIGKLEDESLLISAIESAARKIALYAKCIRKSAKIFFSAENGENTAVLPEDFAFFLCVKRGRGIYGRERFEIIGRKIKSAFLVGECELLYCAYPPPAENEQTVLFEDAYVCDTAVYGAAMVLLTALRPADVQRYMRIATEYDERMAGLISSSAFGVANTFFSGRGIFI